MNPRERKFRQSQQYKAVKHPRKPEFNWTCPNCGGSRNRPNFVEAKYPMNFNGTQYWYPFNEPCKNHVPSKEDIVRHLLSKV